MPIRPERPEDFEHVPLYASLGALLREYVLPGLREAVTATTPFSDRFAIAAFGHPWAEIKPEFWIWRALADVPRESDLCPWL